MHGDNATIRRSCALGQTSPLQRLLTTQPPPPHVAILAETHAASPFKTLAKTTLRSLRYIYTSHHANPKGGCTYRS